MTEARQDYQMSAQMAQVQAQQMYQTMELGGLQNTLTYGTSNTYGQTTTDTIHVDWTNYQYSPWGPAQYDEWERANRLTKERGEPVPQYIYQDGKMRRVQNWEEEVDKEIQERLVRKQAAKLLEDMGMKKKTTKSKEKKVIVKLTLKEAKHLEEACDKDEALKDILAKIEEEVDFQIVVSFRDEDVKGKSK